MSDSCPQGYSVADLCRRWKVGPDKIRAFLRRGELIGVNVATNLSARPSGASRRSRCSCSSGDEAVRRHQSHLAGDTGLNSWTSTRIANGSHPATKICPLHRAIRAEAGVAVPGLEIPWPRRRTRCPKAKHARPPSKKLLHMY